jgi:hypothetical protein
VLVAWSLGDTDVDTYLRVTDDPRPLVDAVRTITTSAPSAGTTTGEQTID